MGTGFEESLLVSDLVPVGEQCRRRATDWFCDSAVASAVLEHGTVCRSIIEADELERLQRLYNEARAVFQFVKWYRGLGGFGILAMQHLLKMDESEFEPLVLAVMRPRGMGISAFRDVVYGNVSSSMDGGMIMDCLESGDEWRKWPDEG